MDEPCAVDANISLPKKLLVDIGSLTAFKNNADIKKLKSIFLIKQQKQSSPSLKSADLEEGNSISNQSAKKDKALDNSPSSRKLIILTMLLLPIAVVEFFIGYVDDNLVLTTSGLMLIVFTSFFTIKHIGVRITKRPADVRFHFGYHKIESFVTLMISLGMILTVGILLYNILQETFNPTLMQFSSITIASLFVASMVSCYAMIYTNQVQNSSRSILQDVGKERLFFSLSSIVALTFSIGMSEFKNPNFEIFGSTIIIGFILYIVLKATKNSFLSLLDSCHDTSLPQQIQRFVEKELGNRIQLKEHQNKFNEKDSSNKECQAEVVKIREILLRHASSKVQAEIHIEMNECLSLSHAETVINNIEELICSKYPDIKRITIIPHPTKKVDKVIEVKTEPLLIEVKVK